MLRLEPTIDLITGEPEPALSENALRVLEKRYLKKDETGKVIETPRELFWRVSWNLAQADRLYGATEEQVVDRARTFYRMLAALEFLPNSPTLMNAGLELQQLSACFAAGTPISTKEGPKPIEEVRTGDLVLTHTGRYRRVVVTMRREAPVLRIQVRDLPAMFATEDHPFLTPEGWVRAGELAGRHVRVGGIVEPVTRGVIEFETELNGQLVELAVGPGHTPAMRAEYVSANATAQPWSLTLGGKPMYVPDGAYLVESVEPVDGIIAVYNLEVEEDSTYVANGVVVHNCFVLPVEDSLSGIFQTLKESAAIHQSGGGTGFSFSRLRPKGDFVRSTTGVASGPVSFMKIFDAATQEIKQGGKRRGANMGILRVDHPDILDFITCKDDIKEITNFNISVAVTDRFMEAVAKGETYDLVSPRTGKPVKQLDAREVFEKIAHQAWKNGEPGLFFIDETNRRQSCNHIGEMEATNPCVAGDTMGSTERGLVPIRELAERGSADIVVDARASGGANGLLQFGTLRARAVRVWKTGVKPVWRLATRSGYSIEATEDHRFLTPEGWKPLGVLAPGDRVLLQSGEGLFPEDGRLPQIVEEIAGRAATRGQPFQLPRTWSEDLGFALGWLVGDGWLRSGDKDRRVGFTFASGEREAMEKGEQFMAAVEGRRFRPGLRPNGVYHLSFHAQHIVEFFQGLGVGAWQSHEKRVPAAILRSPREAAVGFLRGLFGADGTANFTPGSNAYVRLTSTSRDLADDVQKLLIHFGIRSTVYLRTKSKPSVFHYTTVGGEERADRSQHELFEVSVSRSNVPRILAVVGDWLATEKRDALLQHGYYSETFEDEVVAVEPAGFEEVFDLEEPTTHSFLGNCYIIHNCGEQPLLSYESCNLGSVNLEKHMVRGKNGTWDVDWKKLERTARTAARMLDNVVDMNNYPVKQIEEMTKATRKIGLGIMGFARMLFMLEVPYDSPEGVAWGKRVMKFVEDIGYDESTKLAEERGPYPAWEGSQHWKAGKKVRNSYVTTVAPTGTLSMIADTSGGCEPEFSLLWFKRVMDGTELPYFLEYFEEVAKREGFWTQDLVKRIQENQGRARGLKGVPEKWQKVFAVSFDVSPQWHVRMQAAYQDHCDAAISKTCNVPREATVEDVKTAYLLAHKLKCKGITVYRDGSREDQVLNVGVAEEKGKPAAKAEAAPVAVTRPRPRPTVIQGRTQKVLTGYGPLYVTINEDDKGLFELFAQIGRGGGYTASFSEGIGRLVALCLRSGVPVDEIIDQLEGVRSPRLAPGPAGRIYSIPDAIAKAIKRHIGMQKTGVMAPIDSYDAETGSVHVDDELDKEAHPDELVKRGLNPECPECGRTLVLEEGCAKCRHCGYSEC